MGRVLRLIVPTSVASDVSIASWDVSCQRWDVSRGPFSPSPVVEYTAKEEPAMKKRLPKKLELSRETLRSLAETRLPEAAGGFSQPSCPVQCGSDANTVCFATCACTSPAFCE